MAVGGGLPFTVDESVASALNHTFSADSLDFSYHACATVGGVNNQRLEERGYFWISSYQDAGSVVDSQINDFQPNGYHLYGRYTYRANQASPFHPTPTGERLNYVVGPANAAITLHVDPFQDTTIALVACQIVVTNDADDWVVGTSNAVAQGEKSETDGLANGDFKVVFSNWVWSPDGDDLFGPPEKAAFNANFFVFNGNLTNLGGPLGASHNPEGSGNIFWLEDFEPVHED
jgi:hypothetical protein